MIKIALFNHKGGVGKTTLTVNLAGGLVDNGKRVLILDADPQCNASAFFLPEKELDDLLGESKETESGATLWAAIKPVVEGVGDILKIEPREICESLWLAPGDVLLSQYEEELPAAWTDSFARKGRGYSVMGALSRAANSLAAKCSADVVLYDIGPNVGALNRVVLLDCDYFVSPVAPDLFSLRALTSVGNAVARWIRDWRTVQSLVPDSQKQAILSGNPTYLGYVISAFKAYGGSKSGPHEYWEAKIAPRVKSRVVDALQSVDARLALSPPYKLGQVKHYQSLAALAQDCGLPIGWLTGHVNSGYNPEISTAKDLFKSMAAEIIRRTARRA